MLSCGETGVETSRLSGGPLGVVLVALALLLPAQAAAVTTTQLDSTVAPNRAVGKLFVDFPDGTTACSAAVVDAPNQSTILTAGHCLSSVDHAGGISGARFYPGWRDNTAPFGRWEQFQVLPAPQWVGTTNYRYDYGFIVLARNAAGTAIEDAVGALPIAFNQPRVQDYRVFGYPREPTPPYDGQKLWACDTTWSGDVTTGAEPGPYRLEVECDFGHGASGGPWLSAQGAVASLSSTSPVGFPNIERGPYLGGDAAALFATAGNISTAPPPVARRKRKCKKKRRKGARIAKKKKCKKKRRR